MKTIIAIAMRNSGKASPFESEFVGIIYDIV